MADNNNLVTKDYLDKRLARVEGEMAGIKGEMVKMKDEIVEMKDEIMGELKDMREEFSVHQFSHQRINDSLEEHETRLAFLEHPASSPSTL